MAETVLQYVKIFFSDRKQGKALIAALEQLRALPLFEQNKQLRAIVEFDVRSLCTIEGMQELLHSTPGIIASSVHHYASSSQSNCYRNQGGGFVQKVGMFEEFRVRLSNGKTSADETKETLPEAVTAAFKAIGMPIPDSIRKVIS